MPYKEGVPQNPKAERHLRLLIVSALVAEASNVPQNPKAERHLRQGHWNRLEEPLQVPQNPKAERHLRLLFQVFALQDILNGSPEPKSRKAFETICCGGGGEVLCVWFPRTQKPKGI